MSFPLRRGAWWLGTGVVWKFVIQVVRDTTGTFFFPFIFISWRLIILQYCGGFCHTLTWISHGFTCVLHPDPPSRLPLHPIPLGLPSDLSHASNLGWWCLSPLIVYLFQCCRTGIFNQGLLYFRVVFLPLPLLQYKYRPYTKTLQILKAY